MDVAQVRLEILDHLGDAALGVSLSPHDTPSPESPRPPRPTRYHWYASRYLCVITLVVILLLAFYHACASIRRRSRRQRLGRLRPQRDSHAPAAASMLSKSAAVVDTVKQKALVLTTLPPWLYAPDTMSDAFCTIAYCALLSFYSVNKTTCEYMMSTRDGNSADTSVCGGDQNLPNQIGVLVSQDFSCWC